ncbi:MAG: outer membrane protein OmpA-like peptidoglycan-associated protein [Oleispira sp.]|jgi:outer membrane protein OmpA-like peptidoglycan-associated protein
MVKIRYLGLTACISIFSLSPWFVNADSYWQSGSGLPVQDSSGVCVIASLAEHEVAACKPTDRVILLPGDNGKAGAVLISSKGATHRLDQAYKTVSTKEGGLSEQFVSASQVNSEFGELLSALPQPVAPFTVKFVSGSATELTPETAAVINQLLAEVERRDAPEIRLVGHTDSVGGLLKNDRLSKKRAQAVVDILINYGIAPEVMQATGRGEREQAVVTADNVSEAANRRVDVKVR